MEKFNPENLKNLYIPLRTTHKGQNGKLMVIGGSKLFHAASIWSLRVASKIVDMVFYSSVPENNEIIQKSKEEFRDGIVVKRVQLDSYINEADCVVIGPGLPRSEGRERGDDDTKDLTERLLVKYPNKKWVIDGGSLQTIDPKFIPPSAILTPHVGELESLKFKIQNSKFKMKIQKLKLEEQISLFASKHNCVVLLKGEEDIVCDSNKCISVAGGNAGMTKGGTGDVLAGLVGALYCKNDAFLSAASASFINKKAGESLFERVGYYFNSSDLCDEIPRVMNNLIIKKSDN